jgi:Amt family ammonium transporter
MTLLMLVTVLSGSKPGLTTLMQIFASHAIGGVVGNILTGVFAQASIAGFDGITDIPGGWLDRHWAQVGLQLANSVAGLVYSFVVTVGNLVPFV